jgi:hypothetical protein
VGLGNSWWMRAGEAEAMVGIAALLALNIAVVFFFFFFSSYFFSV